MIQGSRFAAEEGETRARKEREKEEEGRKREEGSGWNTDLPPPVERKNHCL
jgi:hypothetical protein